MCSNRVWSEEEREEPGMEGRNAVSKEHGEFENGR